MSIFYYGGKFDPLTIGHEKVIEKILERMDNNDILYIGIINQKEYADSWLESDKKIFIIAKFLKNLEIRNPALSNKIVKLIFQNDYTYDFLKKNNLSNSIVVIGDDEWRDLIDLENAWKNKEKLLKEALFMVMQRDRMLSSSQFRLKWNQSKDRKYDEFKDLISLDTYEEIMKQ